MTLAELPGRLDGPAAHQLPTILEVDALTRLGTALGRTWFAWTGERELRVELEVRPEALGDSLDPTKRVILHATEKIPERMVNEADSETPWKGRRSMAPAVTLHRYFKASVLPAGSYAAAVERDGAAANQAERKQAEAPARQRRLQLAHARAKWLAGYDVPLAELGLEEVER